MICQPPVRLLWRFVRVCPNGRLEVQCRECGDYAWLTEREVRSWTECVHCVKYGLRWPPDR